ncbi:MAG: succinyldiaminopimelate transaminase [Microbacteriaceae bacterium]
MLVLPDFPWNALASARERAESHADGIVDLSVGSPVDPTPAVVRRALEGSTDAHGYPTTQGAKQVREAIVDWYARNRGVATLDISSVIPTVGSKEFVGLLPTFLGLGPGDVVVHPSVAYPTYDIGARVVGATPLPSDNPDEWPANTKLIWLNSPGNPTGRVDSIEVLSKAVARARELGAVIVNDECYAALTWDVDSAPSILDARVTGGSTEGVLAAYSLSKQSNLAGYRAAFVAGDRTLVSGILETRKHLGLITPLPIQAAMIAALRDDEHVSAQREVYRRRREVLRPAVQAAGFRIDDSVAGLYLWATRGEPAFDTVNFLADRGILVAPGSFYGESGANHVRIALTATDERIAAAARRLA